MAEKRVKKRIFIHAFYTSLVFVVAFFIYEFCLYIHHQVLLKQPFFIDHPSVALILAKVIHALLIFILDLIAVYFLYRVFEVVYF